MLKVLHPNPSNHNPDPRHDSRENDKSRIVPDNGQCGIILELWRRVRRLADIPRPAPDLEAAAHADDEHEPGHNEDNPPPPLCFGVVPDDILRRAFDVLRVRCKRGFRAVDRAVCGVWLEGEVGVCCA